MSRALFFLLFLFAINSCKTEKSIAARLETGSTNFPIPVFIVPHRDHKNGIEAIALCNHPAEKKGQFSITVIFRDEDQPFFLFDWIYDAFRRHKYNRKRDVETFLFSPRTAEAPPVYSFPTTWSGPQRFHKGFVTHYSKELPLDSFASISGHPVIYINTWNHLFSNIDTNPGLQKDTVYEISFFEASRDGVEEILSLRKKKQKATRQ